MAQDDSHSKIILAIIGIVVVFALVVILLPKPQETRVGGGGGATVGGGGGATATQQKTCPGSWDKPIVITGSSCSSLTDQACRNALNNYDCMGDCNTAKRVNIPKNTPCDATTTRNENFGTCIEAHYEGDYYIKAKRSCGSVHCDCQPRKKAGSSGTVSTTDTATISGTDSGTQTEPTDTSTSTGTTSTSSTSGLG